jgi:hypothetical protein
MFLARAEWKGFDDVRFGKEKIPTASELSDADVTKYHKKLRILMQ